MTKNAVLRVLPDWSAEHGEYNPLRRTIKKVVINHGFSPRFGFYKTTTHSRNTASRDHNDYDAWAEQICQPAKLPRTLKLRNNYGRLATTIRANVNCTDFRKIRGYRLPTTGVPATTNPQATLARCNSTLEPSIAARTQTPIIEGTSSIPHRAWFMRSTLARTRPEGGIWRSTQYPAHYWMFTMLFWILLLMYVFKKKSHCKISTKPARSSDVSRRVSHLRYLHTNVRHPIHPGLQNLPIGKFPMGGGSCNSNVTSPSHTPQSYILYIWCIYTGYIRFLWSYTCGNTLCMLQLVILAPTRFASPDLHRGGIPKDYEIKKDLEYWRTSMTK
jgi:hypothetical protein